MILVRSKVDTLQSWYFTAFVMRKVRKGSISYAFVCCVFLVLNKFV